MLREKAQEYWLLGGILWGLMTVFLVEFVISPLFFGEDFPTFDWRFFAKVLFWVIWGAAYGFVVLKVRKVDKN